MEKRGLALEELLTKHENYILEKLPEISGYPWLSPQDNLIALYPVSPLPGLSSFSSPLTLLVREDPILNLGILLHELSHVLVRSEFEDFSTQETVMSSIAIQILENLQLPAETTREHFNMIHQQRFKKDIVCVTKKEITATLEVLRGG